MQEKVFRYGLVEGFYGLEWDWSVRAQYADFLKENDFGFYLYSPKADRWLREEWRTPWSVERKEKVKSLAKHYREKGLQFGLALSPYEAYLDWGESTRKDLVKKMKEIEEIDHDILCILFDDMKGDWPNLAKTQVEMCHFIAEYSNAKTLIMCPTYYSDDHILEDQFGKQPKGYLRELGQQLDQRFEMFWTGSTVYSHGFTEEHLREVTERLGRKPFIWDNYPVNDVKEWYYLNLLGYERRPWKMSELAAGHVINPMNQAWLSKIPLRTIRDLYSLKDQYNVTDSSRRAIIELCDEQLAIAIVQDMHSFQNEGLKEYSESRKRELIEKYSGFSSPFATEIVDWLHEKYDFDKIRDELGH